jgi:hypothetical protein
MQVRCRNKRLEIPPRQLLIVTPKTTLVGQTPAPRIIFSFLSLPFPSFRLHVTSALRRLFWKVHLGGALRFNRVWRVTLRFRKQVRRGSPSVELGTVALASEGTRRLSSARASAPGNDAWLPVASLCFSFSPLDRPYHLSVSIDTLIFAQISTKISRLAGSWLSMLQVQSLTLECSAYRSLVSLLNRQCVSGRNRASAQKTLCCAVRVPTFGLHVLRIMAAVSAQLLGLILEP